jgi:hypothetical protein
MECQSLKLGEDVELSNDLWSSFPAERKKMRPLKSTVAYGGIDVFLENKKAGS